MNPTDIPEAFIILHGMYDKKETLPRFYDIVARDSEWGEERKCDTRGILFDTFNKPCEQAVRASKILNRIHGIEYRKFSYLGSGDYEHRWIDSVKDGIEDVMKVASEKGYPILYKGKKHGLVEVGYDIKNLENLLKPKDKKSVLPASA